MSTYFIAYLLKLNSPARSLLIKNAFAECLSTQKFAEPFVTNSWNIHLVFQFSIWPLSTLRICDISFKSLCISKIPLLFPPLALFLMEITPTGTVARISDKWFRHKFSHHNSFWPHTFCNLLTSIFYLLPGKVRLLVLCGIVNMMFAQQLNFVPGTTERTLTTNSSR